MKKRELGTYYCSSFLSQDIKNSGAAMAKKDAERAKAMSGEVLRRLRVASIAELKKWSAANMRCLSGEGIRILSGVHFKTFSGRESLHSDYIFLLGMDSKEKIVGHRTVYMFCVFSYYTGSQLKAIRADQFSELRSDQISLMRPKQVACLDTEQLMHLTEDAIQGLTKKHLENLDSRQFKAIAAKLAAKLSPAQVFCTSQ